MGNHGSIDAGDVQWMTAGRGIIHQEMPKGDAVGRMHGFQLWANLPANYHNGACGFSFADGHAEIKKWQDPDTLSKKIAAAPKGPQTEVDDGRRAMQKIFVDAKIITSGDFDLCWASQDLSVPPGGVIEPFIQVLSAIRAEIISVSVYFEVIAILESFSHRKALMITNCSQIGTFHPCRELLGKSQPSHSAASTISTISSQVWPRYCEY